MKILSFKWVPHLAPLTITKLGKWMWQQLHFGTLQEANTCTQPLSSVVKLSRINLKIPWTGRQARRFDVGWQVGSVEQTDTCAGWWVCRHLRVPALYECVRFSFCVQDPGLCPCRVIGFLTIGKCWMHSLTVFPLVKDFVLPSLTWIGCEMTPVASHKVALDVFSVASCAAALSGWLG